MYIYIYGYIYIYVYVYIYIYVCIYIDITRICIRPTVLSYYGRSVVFVSASWCHHDGDDDQPFISQGFPHRGIPMGIHDLDDVSRYNDLSETSIYSSIRRTSKCLGPQWSHPWDFPHRRHPASAPRHVGLFALLAHGIIPKFLWASGNFHLTGTWITMAYRW